MAAVLSSARSLAELPHRARRATAVCRRRIGKTWLDRLARAGAIAGDLQPDVRRAGLAAYHAIQERHGAIGALVRALARASDRPVSANLYVADGGAFATHWDDHDTILIQTAGRRGGSAAARASPILRRSLARDRPPTALTQEWTQQPGDVVAIPAGWWHVARHAGTRSVHLTLGLGPSSREQWRRWLAERPRQSLVVTVPWRPRTMADGRRVVEVAGRRWSYPRRLAALIEGLAEGPVLAGAAPDGVATLADLASAGLVRPPSWGVSGSRHPRRRVS